jgi:hypothetical protein
LIIVPKAIHLTLSSALSADRRPFGSCGWLRMLLGAGAGPGAGIIESIAIRGSYAAF